jgi:hypothetical protein
MRASASGPTTPLAAAVVGELLGQRLNRAPRGFAERTHRRVADLGLRVVDGLEQGVAATLTCSRPTTRAAPARTTGS